MVLRNFLYLDTSMLNDYLATMEGYLVESSELIENKLTSTSGKGNLKIAEAGHQVDVETGKVSKLKQTDTGNFQKLYDLIDDKSLLQYLEDFDNEIWNDIKRNEIVEMPGILSVTNLFNTLNQVGSISPLIDIMNVFGDSDLVDEKSMTTINGLKAVSEMNNDKEIPVILKLEFSDKYSFAAKLQPEYIRGNMEKLDGEVTMLGKVQKVISHDQEYELFSLTSGIDSLMKHQSRDQRRKYEKNNTDNNVSDKISGPAIILIPLAIYR